MSKEEPRTWVALDTETTGLDASLHGPWEVAVVSEEGEEWCWELPVHLGFADSYSLSVGGYYDRAEKERLTGPLETYGLKYLQTSSQPIAERVVHPSAGEGPMYMREAIEEIHAVLRNRIVVCSNPHFDCKMLSPLFTEASLPAEPWYYHPADIKSIAWGVLVGEGALGDTRLDGRSDAMIDAAVGEAGWSGQHDRHTALGDARWAASFLRMMEERGAHPKQVAGV